MFFSTSINQMRLDPSQDITNIFIMVFAVVKKETAESFHFLVFSPNFSTNVKLQEKLFSHNCNF